MYERSAIVLERYLDKLFGFDKENNLRDNFSNFKELIEELKEYQSMVTEEEKVIKKFDDIAKEIQAIQKLQEKLCLSNQRLEDERNKLFNVLDENPNNIQSKLEKIEKIVDENNEGLKKLREEYIRAFVIFIERQKERVKCAREKRNIESNHIASINRAAKNFKGISEQDVQKMKKFVNDDKQAVKINIIATMIKNGKNEKVGFDENVINKAVDVRISISEKEAECYITIYERLKRLLAEIESDNLKLDKFEKVLRDIDVKLAFLKAEKDYIVEFLDNERMTAMGGANAHKKMMEEACENFELDIKQIDNLYELILKEIVGRSTKRAYNELYNKSYLRDIQEKERSFEQELTNIKLNMGAVINSNYWRIEGIKNVYEVFQQEVTEKFDKDLSEYKLEEIEDIPDEVTNIFKPKEQININLNLESKSNNYYEEDNEYDMHKNIYEVNEDEYANNYEDDYDENEENLDNYEEKYKEYKDKDENEYDSYEEKYNNEDDDDEFLSIISKLNNKYDEKGRYIKNRKVNKHKKQKDKQIKKQQDDKDFIEENKGIFNKFFKKD